MTRATKTAKVTSSSQLQFVSGSRRRVKPSLWAGGLLTIALAAAVLLEGGVNPEQWVWSGLIVSLGGMAALAPKRRYSSSRWRESNDYEQSPKWPWGTVYLVALLVCIGLQLIPLPPWLLAALSPRRWELVSAARAAAGQSQSGWASLTLAPGISFSRLLNVLPAAVVFQAMRRIASSGNRWLSIAPIIAIALAESLIGIQQFFSVQSGGSAASVSGTYLNRNHYDGLLEMALPLALAWAWAAWRRKPTNFSAASRANGFRKDLSGGRPSGLRILPALSVGVCLLAGILSSLSRMGLIAAMSSIGIMLGLGLRHRSRNKSVLWRWLIPVLVPVAIIVLFVPAELVLRFAEQESSPSAVAGEIAEGARSEYWKETLPLIAAYPLTGVGLGAFERGFYAFQKVEPMLAIDYAHNDYLQVAAELGLPAFAIALCFAGWITRRAFRGALNFGSTDWELRVGLFASLLSIAIHSFVDFNLYIPANAMALAWIAGVATGIPQSDIAQEGT